MALTVRKTIPPSPHANVDRHAEKSTRNKAHSRRQRKAFQFGLDFSKILFRQIGSIHADEPARRTPELARKTCPVVDRQRPAAQARIAGNRIILGRSRAGWGLPTRSH